jgi:hypothetical protein
MLALGRPVTGTAQVPVASPPTLRLGELYDAARRESPRVDAARALVRAAQRTGIGLTLLPTLYMRSGFGAAGLREDQRRFASTPESVLRIAESVRKIGAGVTAGVALHSLRAVDEGAMREIADAARVALQNRAFEPAEAAVVDLRRLIKLNMTQLNVLISYSLDDLELEELAAHLRTSPASKPIAT